MIVIIPLGGKGERFKKNKYNEPKALIKVLGKPIIFYLLENLNLKLVKYVYIYHIIKNIIIIDLKIF